MKRVLATSVFLFLAVHLAFGQQPNSTADPQEIKKLVSQLSWDNVGVECHFVLEVKPGGEVADKLIKIGKPAADELISVLEDENRGVAAHMILTAIWEPNKAAYQIIRVLPNE